MGAQTKRPKTKRPNGQNVPRQNVPRHKFPGTKRPKTKRPKNKTSQETKRPRDKTSQGIIAQVQILIYLYKINFIQIFVLAWSAERLEMCS